MAERSPYRVPGRGLSLVWSLAACLLLTSSPLFADPAGGAGGVVILGDGPLTAITERVLAERFAPTLVYHGAEEYFPTSPLFPIEDHVRLGDQAGDPSSLEARLGTAAERRQYYEGLSLHEKSALARVYYRAYRTQLDAQPVIVIEYWLYYVQNNYRVRGNLFPLWVNDNHPNDLEHIHVVVHRNADGAYALYEVDGSAHTGTMPANRHRFTSEENARTTRFLVELGSHANAPDANGDGIFTPGADASSGYKILWGVRDRGITWARYHRGYMDARTAANSVVFEYAGRDVAADRQPYELVPVTELATAFADLGLKTDERRMLFENHRPWFSRMFGGDNGSSGKLLVPPPRRPDAGGIGIERFASTERGFLVGTQLNLEQQGAYAGARYAYLLGGAYVPDLMLEADGIVTRHTRYLTAQAMVTYPIDGSTTLMFGKAVVLDALHVDRRQWDWIGAVEFPVGHMRMYFASRSWGPLTKYSKEVRLSYFF